MEDSKSSVFFNKKNKKDALLESESRWEVFSPISLVVLCVMSVLFIRSAQAYTGGSQWEMQGGLGSSWFFNLFCSLHYRLPLLDAICSHNLCNRGSLFIFGFYLA
jgi:hypothetical protein